MRVRRTRRVISYLLIAGGALLLCLGVREIVDSRLGQREARRAFENKQPASGLAPSRPSPSPSPGNISRFREHPKLGDAVAHLEIPRLGADLYVVEGDGSKQLRLGPGHIAGTPMPGEAGNCIIAGHRDTHFRVLKDIRAGDEIVLQTPEGEYRYRVAATQVVSPRDVRQLRPTRDAELHLVTCYPFYFIGSAPKRFIVKAHLEGVVMADGIPPGGQSPSRRMNE